MVIYAKFLNSNPCEGSSVMWKLDQMLLEKGGMVGERTCEGVNMVATAVEIYWQLFMWS